MPVTETTSCRCQTPGAETPTSYRFWLADYHLLHWLSSENDAEYAVLIGSGFLYIMARQHFPLFDASVHQILLIAVTPSKLRLNLGSVLPVDFFLF